jgi:hypothetical protein
MLARIRSATHVGNTKKLTQATPHGGYAGRAAVLVRRSFNEAWMRRSSLRA